MNVNFLACSKFSVVKKIGDEENEKLKERKIIKLNVNMVRRF